MAARATPLTAEERDHFVDHGWLHLKNCFTREQAEAATSDVWVRLGMDPKDKSTWSKERIHMPHHREFDASQFAPRAWAAIYGDFFVHYLDSPEQGLLVIPLFTDIVPGGGGTYICPEAMPKVAKYLYQNPAGVSPIMQPRGHPNFPETPFSRGTDWFNELAQGCSEFIETHGQCGDVFLLHPLMLHAASNNMLRHVHGNYTLVERATLKALGKEDLGGWEITGPRQEVVPERVKIQERIKQEELERLQAREAAAAPIAGA
ncbi:unnamed protein product [Parascedosporium putredinis]|uniref:Phytanoyl-CoA dioxygenase n=1 Tax=Parascedosporium putredinis TaxID=1442378 RepID=A0A9P1M8L7_9PEZI|nr:unnamed protein product [Parascedosporium putredinis]CAI7989197.1 unnamed protein product [Parascedosporium putredinis]